MNWLKAAAVFLVVLSGVVFLENCGKMAQPVSSAGGSVLNVSVPLHDPTGQVLGATTNLFYYCVSGSGSPVTGVLGPITNASGTYSFTTPLNGSGYNLISVEVANGATSTALGVGAVAFSPQGSQTVPVTVGSLLKTCYTVTALPLSSYYNFEYNQTATTATGMDIFCYSTSSPTGWRIDSPTSSNSIAYMGNGAFANFLSVPASNHFESNSSLSKGFVITGTTPATGYPLAVGDVYCVKLSTGGYAWLQITSTGTYSTIGPSFVFRLNTTQNYCGYEQSRVDPSSAPTPYAPQLAITGLSNNAVGIAVNTTSAAASTIYVVDSGSNTGVAASVRFYNTAGTALSPSINGILFPGTGIGVDPSGVTLFVTQVSTFNHNVVAYSASTGNAMGLTIGSSTAVTPPDTVSQANLGQMAAPENVCASSASIYVTDTGTSGLADVISFVAGSGTPGGAGTYWSGIMGASNNVCGIATDGSKIYVADANNSRIEVYPLTGGSTALSSWTTDNNPNGAMGFNVPQGISVSNGLLFIADTGNNRIVEMTTSGVFKATWGTWGLGSSVTPSTFGGPVAIASDGANPPNVYVADTNNRRVLQFKGF